MGGGCMIDARLVAMGVLGAVDWQSEVAGFCRCQGRIGMGGCRGWEMGCRTDSNPEVSRPRYRVPGLPLRQAPGARPSSRVKAREKVDSDS